jgi:hypothetical protein
MSPNPVVWGGGALSDLVAQQYTPRTAQRRFLMGEPTPASARALSQCGLPTQSRVLLEKPTVAQLV